jgi:hypothetical protein
VSLKDRAAVLEIRSYVRRVLTAGTGVNTAFLMTSKSVNGAVNSLLHVAGISGAVVDNGKLALQFYIVRET